MRVIDSKNFMINSLPSGVHYLNYSIGDLVIHLAGFNLKNVFDKLVDRVVDYYMLINKVKK